MAQIVSLILAIVGLVMIKQRGRVARLYPEDYPDVSAEEFGRWKRLELRSIDAYLWTSFGVYVVSWSFAALVAIMIWNGSIGGLGNDLTQPPLLALLLIGLVASAVYGTKAGRLRKRLGIPRLK